VAANEVREARVHYDAETPGLGQEFTDEVRSAIGRIVEFPEAWPVVESPVRRTIVNRFPYVVYDAIDAGSILVLGVYHARRMPLSWRACLTASG